MYLYNKKRDEKGNPMGVRWIKNLIKKNILRMNLIIFGKGY